MVFHAAGWILFAIKLLPFKTKIALESGLLGCIGAPRDELLGTLGALRGAFSKDLSDIPEILEMKNLEKFRKISNVWKRSGFLGK